MAEPGRRLGGPGDSVEGPCGQTRERQGGMGRPAARLWPLLGAHQGAARRRGSLHVSGHVEQVNGRQTAE